MGKSRGMAQGRSMSLFGERVLGQRISDLPLGTKFMFQIKSASKMLATFDPMKPPTQMSPA
jgi:hypothetical protein